MLTTSKYLKLAEPLIPLMDSQTISFPRIFNIISRLWPNCIKSEWTLVPFHFIPKTSVLMHVHWPKLNLRYRVLLFYATTYATSSLTYVVLQKVLISPSTIRHPILTILSLALPIVITIHTINPIQFGPFSLPYNNYTDTLELQDCICLHICLFHKHNLCY